MAKLSYPAAGASPARTVASTYSPDGLTTAVADPSGNGTSVDLAYDPAGAESGVGVTFASGDALMDVVTRSQTRRVVSDTLTDGSAVSTFAYTCDGAGRLSKAVIPGHTLTYGSAVLGAGSTVRTWWRR